MRFFVMVFLALLLLVPASWSSACTAYDTLPLAIDPLTQDADLPCVLPGILTPSPGAVVLYDHDGSLQFLDMRGRFLDAFGRVVDDVRRFQLTDKGFTVGDWVITAQHAQLMVQRALRVDDVTP